MFSRRKFLAEGLSFAAASVFSEKAYCSTAAHAAAERKGLPKELKSLVPGRVGVTADYFDTWHAQYYLASIKVHAHDLSLMVGSQGSKLARAELNEANLLGSNGVANECYPSIRQDLYFVLDDGWDVPLHGGDSSVGSQVLDPQRFPSITGTPPQRLTHLNREFQAKGWRAAGLWIAAQMAPVIIAKDKHSGINTDTGAYLENYWKTRLIWSDQAGIGYWKVDWGKRDRDHGFRTMLSAMAKQYAPRLTIEGTVPRGPLNGGHDGEKGIVEQEWLDEATPLLHLKGTFRTYDAISYLAIPTTLDRVAALLRITNSDARAVATLNCQDEAYIGAVLGCDLGIMRHAIQGVPDVADPGPRHVARRLTETVRAVRWHRIAPPTSVGTGLLSVDNKLLWDSWQFSPGETWLTSIIGKEVKQAAPARIARGVPLPEVKVTGEPPYVIASKDPNGSLAVGTLGRMSSKVGWFEPRAYVSVEGAEIEQRIGVFGHYKSLNIKFNRSLVGCRVWAQDLASDVAIDITSRVVTDGAILRIEGAVIDHIGLSGSAQDDDSDPGLVLVVR